MSIGNFAIQQSRYNIFMIKFDEWLWQEYEKFAKIPGSRRVKSQAEFARYLGVTTGSLSRWLNADNPPGYDNVIALANKLGNDIYEVTGFKPPAPLSISEWIANRSPEEIAKLASAMDEWKTVCSDKGIDTTSPESAMILVELVKRSNDASMR